MTGNNDVEEYFWIAQKSCLNVVLRPGTYVCGEHERGGFPAWLSEVHRMEVRNASKYYIDRLAAELKPLMVTNGNMGRVN
jgi:beta-galactosidase GanA